MTVESVKVKGLDELRRSLNKADKSLAKELGQAGKAAADIVARAARPKVPVLTGAAKRSVRATTRRGGGNVAFGGAKVPYAGFLDYGNRLHGGRSVGRGDSVPRDYRRGGRIVYPALAEKRQQVIEEYVQLVESVLRKAGL